MVHLIDKSALVAEIERRIESYAKQREDMLNIQCHALADDVSARMGELRCFQDFLDTLEVEECETKSGIVQKDLQILLDDGMYIDLDPSMQLKPSFSVKEGERVKVVISKEGEVV